MARMAWGWLPPLGIGVLVMVGLSLVFALLAGLEFGVPQSDSGIDFWLPMTFIMVGVLLFLWELSMPGFFVAVPGTVAIVLGTLGMVFEGFFTQGPFYWPLIAGMLVAIPASVIVIKLYKTLAPPDALPSTTTGDTMRGKQGTVTVAVNPETTRGKVRVDGVIWSARTETGTIPPDARVEVIEARGVHLLVRPVAAGDRAPEPAPTGASH